MEWLVKEDQRIVLNICIALRHYVIITIFVKDPLNSGHLEDDTNFRMILK
jgi:hypothetical protein